MRQVLLHPRVTYLDPHYILVERIAGHVMTSPSRPTFGILGAERWRWPTSSLPCSLLCDFDSVARHSSSSPPISSYSASLLPYHCATLTLFSHVVVGDGATMRGPTRTIPPISC